jgi:deoxyribodipyrimidine photo-lyase
MTINLTERSYVYAGSDLEQGLSYPGPVIWWIQRDQRMTDNWTCFEARKLAALINRPLVAVFCLQSNFLGAPAYAYRFMLSGLTELNQELERQKIPFIVIDNSLSATSSESPGEKIVELASRIQAAAVVTDFNPLKNVLFWKKQAADKLTCGLIEVDSHNIVPCRQASQKQEFAARTFRPKINRQLSFWLTEFPKIDEPISQQHNFWCDLLSDNTKNTDYLYLRNCLNKTKETFDSIPNHARADLELPESGQKVAFTKLNKFIKYNLEFYPLRNDPNIDAVSGMSPYLHFGQISAQRIALEIKKVTQENSRFFEAATDYLEELIIRKELSDNYCFYNHNYDNIDGFPAWGIKTLMTHKHDIRPYIYSQEQLERGLTHDPLWNAAQKNLMTRHEMPGYLRMYWAKKILEWTHSPEEALRITIQFNDSYALDGRDPNGYTGAAWSIGGVHDRPWAERPVFGQIRLMTLSGCRRKFDVDKWIADHGKED